MNIFFLDRDPVICAQYHCDRHVVKMVTEYSQLLSSAIWVHDEPAALKLYERKNIYNAPYHITGKRSHFNHPMMIWTRESRANFEWLRKLTWALAEEYWHRYGMYKNRQHLAAVNCAYHLKATRRFPEYEFTDPPQSMPEQYKRKDPVKAYRLLYKEEKIRFATYTNREIPKWLRSAYKEYHEQH